LLRELDCLLPHLPMHGFQLRTSISLCILALLLPERAAYLYVISLVIRLLRVFGLHPLLLGLIWLILLLFSLDRTLWLLAGRQRCQALQFKDNHDDQRF